MTKTARDSARKAHNIDIDSVLQEQPATTDEGADGVSFLDLPAEIRTDIYRYSMISATAISVRRPAPTSGELPSKQAQRYNMHNRASGPQLPTLVGKSPATQKLGQYDKPNLALLGVSKQIRREADAFFLKENVFSTQDSDTAVRFLHLLGPRRRQIRHLDIQLSYSSVAVGKQFWRQVAKMPELSSIALCNGTFSYYIELFCRSLQPWLKGHGGRMHGLAALMPMLKSSASYRCADCSENLCAKHLKQWGEFQDLLIQRFEVWERVDRTWGTLV